MKFLFIGVLIFVVFFVIKAFSDSVGEGQMREMRKAARPYLVRLAAAMLIVIALIALALNGASIRLV